MSDTKILDEKYIAHTYGRFPLEIVSGKGSLLYDENGKEYIDMGAGIAVNIFGTADEEWTAAVEAQLKAFSHTSNLFYSAPCAKLAEQLCDRTGMEKVFFSNSGAEANECAIKAARKHAEDLGIDGSVIITLKGSFHGRTVTTVSATGQDSMHVNFHPLTQGFVYADPGDLDGIKKIMNEQTVAAVMIETIQGEGGINVLDAGFVKGIADLCANSDTLFIVDEVQTGNGRTGKLYSYMNYGVKPDIFTTAKGLGGGLPIGATVFGVRAKDIYVPGTHGSTFGGNPTVCAGAINILSRIDDALMSEVTKKSDYIVSSLKGAPGVKGVTGKGLMLGIETEKDVKDVLTACRENGLIVLSAKNKVRLLPPLNIPFELVEKAVSILKTACV